jgi:acetyl esterase
MRKYFASQSGLFHPRVLVAFALCSAGALLAMLSFAGMPAGETKNSSARSAGDLLFAKHAGHSSANVKAAVTTPPAAPLGPTTNLSNGITFDHAMLNDPVVILGEPDISIDNKGGIYVSGPGGSPTQTSWFWKSDDKGIQWHSVGCVPIGKPNCQNGGGDTEITLARNNDVFASDLQTLQCNSTFRSYDEGKTFDPGEGCFPETDRQWMGVYDPNASATGRRIYLGANHVGLSGCYILVSTDNGITYQPPNPTTNPEGNIGGSCIGRYAIDPTNGDIFVPTSGGTTRVSTDGGLTWQACGSSGAQGNFFANIARDTGGNLWQGWTTSCSNPATTPCKAFISYSTDKGQTWHAPIQVNTGPSSPLGTSPDLRQMLFPWIVAGDPGRVAFVFYATPDTARAGGFPGGVNALWHTYAVFSTNAMDLNPAFTQVQVDEHVFHRSTICTGGFPGCLTGNADRSLADFFMVDKDTNGRVFIAYNENSDLSLVVPDPPEYIGKPINAIARLRTGPSLFAAQGNLLPDPAPANVAITSASVNGGTLSVSGTQGLPPGNWTTDAANDAIFPVVPAAGPNQPALDIQEVSASDDGTNLTFKLKLSDLSTAALAQAAPLEPSWMVMWWQGKGGLGPANMTSGPFHSHWFVKWLGSSVFEYGRVSSIDFPSLGAPNPQFLSYPVSGTTTGTVAGNEVTINVPMANLMGLAAGDKIDNVTAYGLGGAGTGAIPVPFVVDQAKSFSYVIGTPASGQHLSDGYVEVSLDGFATSTLATLNNADKTWTASIAGAPTAGTVCARQVLAKDLYTSVWDDVQAGPASCANFSVPIPTGVVSRKTHGTAGVFDINLPIDGFQSSPTPPNTEVYAKADDGTDLHWTVSKPVGAGPWPAVLVIHGGGFKNGGDIGSNPPQTSQDLAAAGFMAFNIEYRFAPPGGLTGQVSDGRYPDQKNDVKLAVQAAGSYPSSTGNVGAIGGSAGGTHALEAAVSGTLGNDRVKAAISLSGPTEFSDPASLNPPSEPNFKTNVENYCFNTYPTVPAEPTYTNTLLADSPISKVDASVSPLFLVDSAGDTMPANQRLHMVAKLNSLGITNYQTIQVMGSGHGFANWAAVKDQAIAFLTANLSPPIGPPGIECRTGGASGDHQVVVTFAVPVTLTSASVSSGTGSVSSVTVSNNQVTVSLTGVTNAQTIAITLFDVNDGINSGNVVVPMSVLLGDTTANGSVNSSDISQTKAQSGTVTNLGNFRTDVTVNGLINSSDISLIKSKSGTALP